ncbi:unnamed protein product [Menidia menidia]|uniref:(Atlantic silverside) hypothetical protein n=1 Tax=Menidia menidia TaxID=238744 RepID=A0A8S4BDZ2_9TELE|nr:unnamed protein product [Menidia menidia]
MAILEALLQSLSLSSLLGGFVVLLCVYLMFSRFQAEGKEPPGPKTLPLLGNILQIDLKSPSKTLMEYYKKYGSIFQIHFGPKKVVVLAGYETVKEALVKFDEEFGYRDIPDIMYQVNKGHGVLWSNGDSWKEMRRFALTNLRDFGMGKKACEDKILEECQHLLEVFKSFKGKPFETTMHLNCAVSNIICSMVYGNRFEYDDPEFTSLVDRTNRSIQLTGSASLEVYSAFPLLSAWFGPSKEYLNLVTTTRKQNSVLLNKLRETLNPQMCRGFVDAYLVRQQQLEESGATDSHFHDSNLLVTVSNLFNAGTETTSTTLRWGLLLMAKYPKIQGRSSSSMGITEALLQSLSSVSLMEYVAALLLLCVLSCSVFRSRQKNGEPPGPTPLPVLGNLLQLDLKRPHNTLLEFSRKYGPVFTVYFGPKKVVVLAGYEAVKDALVNHDEVFGDRDVLHILHEVNQGGGLLWSNGDLWREMRRFSLTNLRDFGMGKKVCEDKIIEECQHLTDEIKKYKGEAFDTTRLMNYAISNIICSMIFGSRSEYDDAEFSNLVDRLNTTAQLLGSSSMQVYNLFPFCKWISSRRRYCQLSAANRKQVTAFISRLRETLIPQMCRGFVDSFLLRKQNLERFRFSPPAGVSEEELDLTPFPGITLGPAAHQLRAVSRM